MNVPVLMYHRVRPATERSAPCDFVITANTLRRQLNYLVARGYQTPTIGTVLTRPAALKTVRPVLITFDDGYLDNYTEALPLLLEYGLRATVFAVAERRRINFWDKGVPTANAKLMQRGQLREMAAAGMEIGAHGITHRRLDAISDDDARRELKDSKAVLEDVIGAAVDYFAYPFGAVSERVKDLTREAGYRAAFAVNSGPFDFHADPFEIRRVLISDRADDTYLYAKTSGLEKAARTSTSFWRSLVTSTMRVGS